MSFETILHDLDQGVATVTLNRPERMNALNAAMRAELLDALRHPADGTRVIVLTGAGDAF